VLRDVEEAAPIGGDATRFKRRTHQSGSDPSCEAFTNALRFMRWVIECRIDDAAALAYGMNCPDR
jgi:hypothetical protein